MKKYLVYILFVAVMIITTGCSSLNKRINLYENMVNASVMLYNDYSHGSGVFIDDDVILTAAHVLEQPDLKIELRNGVVLEVNDFYIDSKEDVGFIFVKADELYISKLALSCGDIGDVVYLVGSPYEMNLVFTITKGILSNLGIDIWSWEDLLQTDAEGAPGSSGGPLYDFKGDVIGICVTGVVPGGGVTLCESVESILEAYKRCVEQKD